MQGRLDGVVNALLLVCLPVWFYIAVHVRSLASWEHFWSVLILGAAPCCLLAILEGAATFKVLQACTFVSPHQAMEQEQVAGVATLSADGTTCVSYDGPSLTASGP